MSRTFTRTDTQYLGLGVGGVGALINGESAVSFHAWIKPADIDGGADNENRVLSCLLASNNSSVIANISATSSNQLRVGARSQSADSFQKAYSTTAIGTGAWVSVGFVIDYANDQIKVYVDGTLETTQAVTFGATTYTHSDGSLEDSYSDSAIGTSSASQGLRFSGDIAECAFWSGDIGTSNFGSLAGGATADTITGFTLLSYIPIDGTSDPEPDNGTPGLTTNLVGSPAQGSEPPLSADTTVSVPLGTITLTGYAPTVTGSNDVTVSVPLGTITLTGYAPTVTASVTEILSGNEGENINLASSSVSGASTTTPTVTLVPYSQVNEVGATTVKWWSWAGRVSSVNGKTPTFKIDGAAYYQTGPSSGYRPQYSEDGSTWSFFDNFTPDDGSGNWSFYNDAAFSAATVYVSYCRPYTNSDVASYISSISGSSYVSETTSTTSFIYGTTTSTNYDSPFGGNIPSQNLYAFKISDSSVQPADGYGKRTAVLSAGVHPSEDIGNEMLEAAVDFLLSADPVAQDLRRNFDWYIYPMVNPTGRYGRNVRGTFETGTCGADPKDEMDPNRHLGDGCLEVNSKWKTAFEADTGSSIDLYLDFHGFVSPIYDHWYNSDIPGSVAFHAALQAYIPTIGGNTSSIPTNNRNYIATNYGAKVSDTMEMGFHLNPTVANTVTLAETSLKAVDDLYQDGWFTDHIIDVPAASITITGYAPTVSAGADQVVEVPVASLSLTANTPTVSVSDHKTVDVPAASLSLTAFAPTVTAVADQVVDVPAGSLSLTAYAPTVSTDASITVQVPAGSVSLNAFAPVVNIPAAIDVPAASLTIAANAPTVTAGTSVSVPLAELTLTAFIPGISITGNVSVPVGAITLTGYAPTPIVTNPESTTPTERTLSASAESRILIA